MSNPIPALPSSDRLPSRGRRLLSIALPATALAGCALTPWAEPPRVDLVGIDSLPGQGLELRFMLRLRVQNRNGAELTYEGISLELDLRGQRFASGVAPVRGAVPGYGEAIVSVPVTVPALSLARQLIDVARGAERGDGSRITYALRGRLGGGAWGGARFSREGEIDLSGIGS